MPVAKAGVLPSFRSVNAPAVAAPDMKRLRVKCGFANVRELLMIWIVPDLPLSLRCKDTLGTTRKVVKQNLDTVKTTRDKSPHGNQAVGKTSEKAQRKRKAGARGETERRSGCAVSSRFAARGAAAGGRNHSRTRWSAGPYTARGGARS